METKGLPGIGTTRTATPRTVRLSDQGKILLPRGGIIDGSESRDPANTGDIDCLRAGLLMGKATSGGLWSPCIIGKTNKVYVDDETTLQCSLAVATELIRRIGTSGEIYCIGPPSAAGTVALTSIDFTGVTLNGATSTITIPDLNLAIVTDSLITTRLGDHIPKALIDDGYPIKVTDKDGNNIDVPFPTILVGGVVDWSQVIGLPADASTLAWVKDQLQENGLFIFDDAY